MNAVIFIDVESDFLLEGAYNVVTLGGVCGVDLKNKFIKFALSCRKLGWQIFATKESGDMIIPELTKDSLGNVIIPKGHIVTKTTFGDTNLADKIKSCFSQLQENREHIFVCGIRTSLCVLANTVFLNSLLPEDRIALVSDLCADYTKEKTDIAIKALENLGIQSTTSDRLMVDVIPNTVSTIT